jgi:signal transduction histidine kinase
MELSSQKVSGQELSDTLFRMGRFGWPVHLGVVGTIGFGLPGEYTMQWGVFLMLLSLVQVAVCHAPKLPHRETIYTLVSMLVGASWGLFSFSPDMNNTANLNFFTLAIGGTSLGAVSIQYPKPWIAFLSLVSVLPLIFVRHLIEPEVLGPLLSTMIALYTVLLALIVWQTHIALLKNIHLIEALRKSVEDADLARAHAVQADLAKSNFLAQASHDLRQPLHAMGLFVNGLKAQLLPDEARRLTKRIDATLDVLAGMFKSLLDVSLLDLGRVKPKISQFPLQPMLDKLQMQFEPLAQSNGARLKMVRTGVWLKADPQLIQRILMNLISNAIKYAPGKKIVVGCRRRNKRIDLEVHDQGAGIPSDQVDAIFAEFQRFPKLDDGTRPAGVGLGLAIISRLAKLLNYGVEVRSVPGRGSCFRLSGVEPGKAVVASEFQDISPMNLLRNLQVAVIDSDLNAVQSCCKLLGEWGCLATPFYSMPHSDALEEYELILCNQQLWNPQVLNNFQGQVALLIKGSDGKNIHPDLPALPENFRPAQLRSVLLTLMLIQYTDEQAQELNQPISLSH